MGRRWWIVIAVLSISVAACGTRVSDERFAALLEGEGAVGAPAGPAELTEGPDLDAPPDDEDERTAGATPDGSDDDSGAVAAGPRGNGTDTNGTAPEAQGGQGGNGDQASARPNRASDVGVTEDTLRVGNLVSLGGPLGRNAFGPAFYGANAYFTYLNQAQGGVHGRTVEFEMCDDAEDGSRNLQCAQNLVENQEIFAFVANSTRAYAAAEYVWEQGVPDILGQPIGNEYWQYPTHYGIRGGLYPRDGEQMGYQGQFYGGTLISEYIRREFNADTAAVFFFDVPISRAFGLHMADTFEAAGFEVLTIEVNPVAPNFAARVEQMQQAGVEVIADAMDVNANRNLCRAMDDKGFQVEAKVTTTQGMGRGIGDYSHPCRESIIGISEALPYSETDNEEVALFHDVMSRVYGGQFDDSLAQWAWEGWIAARSFTLAVEEMGPEPTREGLMDHYDRQEGYTSGGLLSPIDWRPLPFGRTTRHEQCMVVSQWNEDRFGFERITPMPLCERVEWRPWAPA